MTLPPPRSTLFPYTTLFRSSASTAAKQHLEEAVPVAEQFVPRFLYSHYLNDVLKDIERDTAAKIRLQFETGTASRSEEHTSELQSHVNLVCRLLLEKKK